MDSVCQKDSLNLAQQRPRSGLWHQLMSRSSVHQCLHLNHGVHLEWLHKTAMLSAVEEAQDQKHMGSAPQALAAKLPL